MSTGSGFPWEPTVDQVASLIAVRTVDEGGNQVGTFTSDTRPTDVQARVLCETAAQDISQRLGIDVPDEYVPEAQRIAAMDCALLIIASYYPDVSEQRSYVWLQGAFLAALQTLQDDVRHATPRRLP